jgi:hypothetical protein
MDRRFVDDFLNSLPVEGCRHKRFTSLFAVGLILADSQEDLVIIAMKMEAVCSSETSILTTVTRLISPEIIVFVSAMKISQKTVFFGPAQP